MSIEDEIFDSESVRSPLPVKTQDLSRAIVLARSIRRDVVQTEIYGDVKNKSMFLETNHSSHRIQIENGLLIMVESGLDILSQIEDPRWGISDKEFDRFESLSKGISRLMAPKNDILLEVPDEPDRIIEGVEESRYGYQMKRTPRVRTYPGGKEVLLDAKSTNPRITTFYLKSIKQKSDIPRLLYTEVMPRDYRSYRRGYGRVERRAMSGGRRAEVGAALSEAGAEAELIEDIIDSVLEKNAYIRIEEAEIAIRAEAMDEEGERVKVSFELPRGLPDHIISKLKKYKSQSFSINNEIPELSMEVNWSERDCDFFQFLKSMNYSLRRVWTESGKKAKNRKSKTRNNRRRNNY